jgi:tetratricopeptide (TPR) repeat protein
VDVSAPPRVAPVQRRVIDSGKARSSTLRDAYRAPTPTPSSRTETGSGVKPVPGYRETLTDRYRRQSTVDVRRVAPESPARVDTPGGTARPTPVAPGKAAHRYPTRVEGTTSARPAVDLKRDATSARLTPVSPIPRTAPRSVTPVARTADHPRVTRSVAAPVPRPVPVPTPRALWTPLTTYYSPAHYYYGYAGWHHSSLSLSFSFGFAPSWCNWGLYSYPFYFSACYPSWYWRYRCSYGYYWNSSYPWYGYSYCWPKSYYCPSVYVSYRYYGDVYDDAYDDGSYYSTAGSSVVVQEGQTAGNENETIVSGSTAHVPRAAGATARTTEAEHHVSLGDFYFKEERFQEAVDSYLRALALAPDDASIRFVLADALFATGDYHYAAFMIREALDRDPGLARADTDKRTFYKDAATFERQLDVLRKYVAEKPYDAAAQLVLGYNFKFSKRSAEAKDVFARVLELDKSDAAARVFLDAIRAEEAPSGKGGGGTAV